uniref:Chromo domain-containing protein n=1 Tax=Phytophthora ramorum TaxID=164328 RepID=H3GS34_PHYRM
MPSTKPKKNDISSAKEFKTLCIAARKAYKIRWLAAPDPGDDEGSDEEEKRSAEEDLTAEMLHYVRKLLNWKREKRQTYYIVEWEATWECREHLSKTVVAAFEKERRLLVQKKFIEEEAVKDNTINTTEK